MKVLVTGAAGFIGRWAVAELVRAKHAVHALTSPRRLIEVPLELRGATLEACDLFDGRALDAVFERVRPTHLLHFAWVTTPGEYWKSPENARWQEASEQLIRRFRAGGGERVVVAGSCAEYDWSRVARCRETSSPLIHPDAPHVTAYAASKVRLHDWLAKFAYAANLSYAWGRIFFQYGPYEHRDRLVASVMISLLEGHEALCSAGEQVRSFLHAADVGAAFARLLESAVSGPVNIGSAQDLPVRDLILRIGALTGRSELIRLGARHGGENPPVLLPELTRLSKEVGFTPRFTLETGLLDTLNFWRRKMA